MLCINACCPLGLVMLDDSNILKFVGGGSYRLVVQSKQLYQTSLPCRVICHRQVPGQGLWMHLIAWTFADEREDVVLNAYLIDVIGNKSRV